MDTHDEHEKSRVPRPGRVGPKVRRPAPHRAPRLRPREMVPITESAVSRVFPVQVTRDGRVHLGSVALRFSVFGIEARHRELWLWPARFELPLVRVRGDDTGLRLWLTGSARLPAYELGLRAFGRTSGVIVEVRVDGVIVLCARGTGRDGGRR